MISIVIAVYLVIGLVVGLMRDYHEMNRAVPYPNSTSLLSLRQIRIACFLDALLIGPVVIILALLSMAGWIEMPKDRN